MTRSVGAPCHRHVHREGRSLFSGFRLGFSHGFKSRCVGTVTNFRTSRHGDPGFGVVSAPMTGGLGLVRFGRVGAFGSGKGSARTQVKCLKHVGCDCTSGCLIRFVNH